MAGTPDGSTWIGTTRDLFQVRGARSTAYGPKEGLPSGGVTAIAVDRSGRLWIAGTSAIARLEQRRFVPVALPPSRRLANIRALGAASDGTLWIYDDNEGLFTWRGDELTAFVPPPELRGRRLRCLYVDRTDAVWLSFTGGNVLTVRPGGTLDFHRMPDGHALINTIYEDRDGVVWLGGTHGISRVESGRVATVAQSRLPGYAVFSILLDGERNLWLGGALGIARIAQTEFERAVATPGYQPRYELYDATDGLAGMPVWFGTPSAAQSDGRLWFVTTGGATVIDPSRHDGESGTREVQIDSLLANGRPVLVSPGIAFPPDVRNLVFEYSVPALTSPTKVTFRHRLTGVDPSWIDAGARRDVSYANLTPGTYRFDVMAVSSDHGWSESAASLSFSIRPMFYHTRWFFAVCGATAALLGWLAWRMRIRQLRRQFAVIVAERVRMSREIHDTLLQGMVAVALQLDINSERARPSSQPLSENLVRLRKLIEGYIRETRDAIFELRAPTPEGDLPDLIRRTGDPITAGTGLHFDVAVHGQARPLGAGVDRQLLQVAREAIANAARHARARRIHVDVTYRADAVLLRIADDGAGFDADRVAAGANRHFGLQTMRERVQQIGGTLEIRSSPGMGTYIEVAVPIAVQM
jgi:signal transduction histidine kinase